MSTSVSNADSCDEQWSCKRGERLPDVRPSAGTASVGRWEPLVEASGCRQPTGHSTPVSGRLLCKEMEIPFITQGTSNVDFARRMVRGR